jgi:hypothetical protein
MTDQELEAIVRDLSELRQRIDIVLGHTLATLNHGRRKRLREQRAAEIREREAKR